MRHEERAEYDVQHIEEYRKKKREERREKKQVAVNIKNLKALMWLFSAFRILDWLN
jgi:hypothetical protein